ncbi:hypothetical protein Pint_25723 [Pistacia integerrima]|uniref:Uncharacterized protein n=1 Tax=Pistacia integerrima TaxID=434235 RepID=A0ACC0YBZ3_9ROSI|nr:hypothetical protein Pint_25723 [Pistacia integerrima]
MMGRLGESLHLELHQIVGDLCICGVCMNAPTAERSVDWGEKRSIEPGVGNHRI